FFVRVPFAAVRRHQERILVAPGQQIAEQLIVEEDVAVQHDEAASNQIAGQPQRVQAVGRLVTRVGDEVDAWTARAPDVRCVIAGDDGDGVDPAGAQRPDLPLDQRAVADAREALRALADDVAQAVSAPGREDDRPHAPSGTAVAAAWPGPRRAI